MDKFFELTARYDSRKSFYGKAHVIDRGNGLLELQSCDTVVCSLSNRTKFTRLWDGHSQTTSRHIKEFVKQFAKDPNTILATL